MSSKEHKNITERWEITFKKVNMTKNWWTEEEERQPTGCVVLPLCSTCLFALGPVKDSHSAPLTLLYITKEADLCGSASCAGSHGWICGVQTPEPFVPPQPLDLQPLTITYLTLILSSGPSRGIRPQTDRQPARPRSCWGTSRWQRVFPSGNVSAFLCSLCAIGRVRSILEWTCTQLTARFWTTNPKMSGRCGMWHSRVGDERRTEVVYSWGFRFPGSVTQMSLESLLFSDVRENRWRLDKRDVSRSFAPSWPCCWRQCRYRHADM